MGSFPTSSEMIRTLRSEGDKMKTNPLTIFNQNFAIVERLLQMYQLANGLRQSELPDNLKQSLGSFWGEPENTYIKYAANDRIAILSRSATRFPDAITEEGGGDFLLRQAVIMACTSLETYLWEAVCKVVPTLFRLRLTKVDERLKNLTLTLEEYITVEKYKDPEMRLQKIILKTFGKKVFYDLKSIDQIANMLAIRNFWEQVENTCGEPARNIKRLLGDLLARRNQITHRADRPTDTSDVDRHGLRKISFSWVNIRIHAAKT
ncbi:MAG: hypothetical protein JW902_14460, partial [Syntrophaceae bacterium]|nr:hypothetical protein [Syntrophaceae bacterium]